MGFCEYTFQDGIFILTLDAGDGGHNYLTLQSAAELVAKLKEIRRRARTSTKGLITNSAAGGSFSDGVDYAGSTPEAAVVDELAYLVAEAALELYNMPFPTVAAVTGDVRSSLAMAVVLAHDEIAATRGAVFEVAEVRDGRAAGLLPPPYFASLLRDRAAFPRMRSAMVLCSEAMTLADMNRWEVFDPSIGDDDAGGVKAASSVIKASFGNVRDGQAYITTRKSFFPEAWKAISDFLSPQA